MANKEQTEPNAQAAGEGTPFAEETPRDGAARPKKKLHIAWVVLIDFILLCIGLGLYTYVQVFMPVDEGTEGTILPEYTQTQQAATPAETAALPADTETPAQTASIRPQETGEPATAQPADWSASFPQVFTDGGIVSTETSYKSGNVSIEIRTGEQKVENGKAVYYVADIYVRDKQYFRTALESGEKFRRELDTVDGMAEENDALLAITGDNCLGTSGRTGPVVRNGKLYREKPFEDVLVMYHDGTMRTFEKEDFDIEEIKKTGAWQVWSFGPMLLKDGKPMKKFNSRVAGPNPRAAVGYYEPGHYCFVLVDGRQRGYSNGMTMEELSGLMESLGCKVAYNQDGGESAVLVFQGRVVNRPFQDGRNISDIIYITE